MAQQKPAKTKLQKVYQRVDEQSVKDKDKKKREKREKRKQMRRERKTNNDNTD